MNTPYWRILLPEIQLKLLGQFLSAQNLSHKIRLSFSSKNLHRSLPSHQSSVNATMHLQRYELLFNYPKQAPKN
jgi:hypothetical protein